MSWIPCAVFSPGASASPRRSSVPTGAHVRKATLAEPRQRAILNALGIESSAGGVTIV